MNSWAAQATLEQVIRHLSPRAEALFVRHPLIDPACPATSDLDLLVFGQVDGLLPQRLCIPASADIIPMVDLIWLPLGILEEPETFAANGLIAHRLLGSRVAYDRTGYATRQSGVVRHQMYQPEIQRKRLAGFLELGFLAVREVGVTWDFPPLALFWLHTAHAACLAAMSDAGGSLCPNVYTRPMDYLLQVEEKSGLSLARAFIEALHLDVDPRALVAPLRRIHEVVSSRFPEPVWPRKMRSTTRYEYRYFLDRNELDWRLSVAEELAARGDPAAATYYLRFWAYALARIPMVHQRAQEGRDVSFMRPEASVRADLEGLCPEILGDLTRILGGRPPVAIKEVIACLNRLAIFHRESLEFLRSNGFSLPDLQEWQPFQPPPQAGQT